MFICLLVLTCDSWKLLEASITDSFSLVRYSTTHVTCSEPHLYTVLRATIKQPPFYAPLLRLLIQFLLHANQSLASINRRSIELQFEFHPIVIRGEQRTSLDYSSRGDQRQKDSREPNDSQRTEGSEGGAQFRMTS